MAEQNKTKIQKVGGDEQEKGVAESGGGMEWTDALFKQFAKQELDWRKEYELERKGAKSLPELDAKSKEQWESKALEWVFMEQGPWTKELDRWTADLEKEGAKEPVFPSDGWECVSRTSALLVRKKRAGSHGGMVTNLKNEVKKWRKSVRQWFERTRHLNDDMVKLLYVHALLELQAWVADTHLEFLLHHFAILFQQSPMPLAVRIRIIRQIYSNVFLVFRAPEFKLTDVPITNQEIQTAASLGHSVLSSKANDTARMELAQTLTESIVLQGKPDGTLDKKLEPMRKTFPDQTHVFDTKHGFNPDCQERLFARHQPVAYLASNTEYFLFMLHAFHMLLLLFVPNAKSKKVDARATFFTEFKTAALNRVMSIQTDPESWWTQSIGQHLLPLPTLSKKEEKGTGERFFATCRGLHLHTLTTISQLRRTLHLVIRLLL